MAHLILLTKLNKAWCLLFNCLLYYRYIWKLNLFQINRQQQLFCGLVNVYCESKNLVNKNGKSGKKVGLVQRRRIYSVASRRRLPLWKRLMQSPGPMTAEPKALISYGSKRLLGKWNLLRHKGEFVIDHPECDYCCKAIQKHADESMSDSTINAINQINFLVHSFYQLLKFVIIVNFRNISGRKLRKEIQPTDIRKFHRCKWELICFTYLQKTIFRLGCGIFVTSKRKWSENCHKYRDDETAVFKRIYNADHNRLEISNQREGLCW